MTTLIVVLLLVLIGLTIHQTRLLRAHTEHLSRQDEDLTAIRSTTQSQQAIERARLALVGSHGGRALLRERLEAKVREQIQARKAAKKAGK